MNPINNKRLLNMKSRFWETPDGSAFHPDTSHSPEGGATQQALSADGVSTESNMPEIDALRKGMLVLAGSAGGTKRREERAGQRGGALRTGAEQGFASVFCALPCPVCRAAGLCYASEKKGDFHA